MAPSRTLVALAGLIGSLLVSIAAWVVLDTFLLFLFLSFVPFLLGRGRTDAGADVGPVRRCPQCAFRTTDPSHEYCPRDGSRLRVPDE